MLKIVRIMPDLRDITLGFDILYVRVHRPELDLPTPRQCLDLKRFSLETRQRLDDLSMSSGCNQDVRVHNNSEFTIALYELRSQESNPLPDHHRLTGLITAPGLPAYGFSTFKISDVPTEASFDWRGLNLEFASLDG